MDVSLFDDSDLWCRPTNHGIVGAPPSKGPKADYRHKRPIIAGIERPEIEHWTGKKNERNDVPSAATKADPTAAESTKGQSIFQYSSISSRRSDLR